MKNKNDLIKLCLDLLDSYLISSIIFNSFIFKTLKKPCMKWQKCLFVCNRGDTIHYWTQTNYDAQLHSSMLTTENDIQCQGKLQTRKLDQAPIPNLGQTLSSYPHQQMVWLCRLQDRDSIHTYTVTINHPTTLHTQWNPVTHCCSLMALCTAGCIPQAKLPSLNT